MAQLTFILGGARSGKSSYAVKLAKDSNVHVTYIATGLPCDEEMKERIERHRRSRPESWKTIEEPQNIASAFKIAGKSAELILLDCLSFWVSNLILRYQKKGESRIRLEEGVLSQISQVISVIKEIKSEVIVVSNEVGMGIVPETSLNRIYRDILGKANQMIAAHADKVFLMVAGLPIKVK